jgi:hypothetical protein
VRDAGNGATQTFFKTGEVIIELVGPIPNVRGERPWGHCVSRCRISTHARRCSATKLGPRQGLPCKRADASRRYGTRRAD